LRMSRISPCCGETVSPIVTVMFFLCQSPFATPGPDILDSRRL
jgi:hypothetical protein